LAEEAMQSRDANVRWQGIRCYVTLPTGERMLVLGPMLDDPHPRNRAYVREELFRLAGQPELDGSIREAATGALAGESWRGQEQAALLLAALDHKPAAARLIELLESDRKEVMTATAWALKELAIPETLPALLDKATRQKEQPTGDNNKIDPQLAHLFEAMTIMKYDEAMPLMRRFVPKGSGGEIARSAAIWGLGHLLKDRPDEELAAQLIERAMDTGGMPPEFVLVRQMSVVTIGRMKIESQLPALHRLIGDKTDHGPDDYALRWAILEISGVEVPYEKIFDQYYVGWFLEPATSKNP
jgi:HEAT repeat protein